MNKTPDPSSDASIPSSADSASPQLPLKSVTRFQAHAPASAQTSATTSTQHTSQHADVLAVEEPLEIVLSNAQHAPFTLAITMRTPGQDHELAAGFLFAEGLIRQGQDILHMGAYAEASKPHNSLHVQLDERIEIHPEHLQRYFFTHSSCGVCGKTSMQSLELKHQPQLQTEQPRIATNILYGLPEQLRKQQQAFARTGSVHAAALFSSSGELLAVQEDIGRHNALDKLLGQLLLEDRIQQARDALLLVSGRASFELVQKALMADIAVLAAIGAPSSLALQLAERHGMTLIGFLKPDSFNAYCGGQRLATMPAA